MTQPDNDELLSFADALAQQDDSTRMARAGRLKEVYEALPGDDRPFGRFGPFGLSAAGPESHILMQNAIGCYRDGHYAAALICAHALCEQELSGRLHRTLGSRAPRGSERWGLGLLLGYAASERWFSPTSQTLLEDVNRKRRAFYHYRAVWDDDTVTARAISKGRLHVKDQARAAMRETLREDALQAIRAAFIIRSE